MGLALSPGLRTPAMLRRIGKAGQAGIRAAREPEDVEIPRGECVLVTVPSV